MIDEAKLQLFVLNCAVINAELDRVLSRVDVSRGALNLVDQERSLKQYIKQFELENRINAANMAEYYKLFYLIENDIRGLISQTLEAAHGPDWWSVCVPNLVKDEVIKNKKRESEAGITLRSDRDLDYTTFGQLGDIIRANWPDFAGMLSNQSALGRVLHSLNMSRGTIAHCGVLAEDEIDRLKLNVKDWFRVLAGPSK